MSVQLKLKEGTFRKYSLYYSNGQSQYYSRQNFCLISTNDKKDIEKILKDMGFGKYRGRDSIWSANNPNHINVWRIRNENK